MIKKEKTCWLCLGEGKIRVGNLKERVCPACKGKGTVEVFISTGRWF